jgi:predicted branched-subunit amino acid permease
MPTRAKPLQRTKSRRDGAAVKAGLSDAVPVLIGLAPFGLTIGTAVVESEISNFAGWLGGPVLVAGAAHLSIVTALGTGTAPLLAATTAIVINLRFAAYGAAMAHLFANQPRWFRWSAPYLIFDQVFALAVRRREAAANEKWFRRYWMALTVPIFVAWIMLISVGMVSGPAIPEDWQLWFAVPLMFAAILSPSIRDTRSLRSAITAIAVAAAGTGLPGGIGLVLAVVAGATVGSIGAKQSDE